MAVFAELREDPHPVLSPCTRGFLERAWKGFSHTIAHPTPMNKVRLGTGGQGVVRRASVWSQDFLAAVGMFERIIGTQPLGLAPD